MDEPTEFTLTFDPESGESRLDVFLAKMLPHVSRVAVRRAIHDGLVHVDGKIRKASFSLRGGERVHGQLSPHAPAGPLPEPIPLDIIYEDDDLVVVNKPSGMVVHPAKGHWAGTLTSALAHHFQSLSSIGGPQRPGIVHRLDRDTSGVILVARHDRAHIALAAQFERREVKKEYFALCRGRLDRDRDWVRQPIGAHPYQREKMAIRAGHETSREAATFVEVVERWAGYLAVKAFPETGRTHQIRVHLQHLGIPVLCDPLYAGHRQLSMADLDKRMSASTDQIVLDRLALHAHRIGFVHPTTGVQLEFMAPIPQLFADTSRHFTK